MMMRHLLMCSLVIIARVVTDNVGRWFWAGKSCYGIGNNERDNENAFKQCKDDKIGVVEDNYTLDALAALTNHTTLWVGAKNTQGKYYWTPTNTTVADELWSPSAPKAQECVMIKRVEAPGNTTTYRLEDSLCSTLSKYLCRDSTQCSPTSSASTSKTTSGRSTTAASAATSEAVTTSVTESGTFAASAASTTTLRAATSSTHVASTASTRTTGTTASSASAAAAATTWTGMSTASSTPAETSTMMEPTTISSKGQQSVANIRETSESFPATDSTTSARSASESSEVPTEVSSTEVLATASSTGMSREVMTASSTGMPREVTSFDYDGQQQLSSTEVSQKVSTAEVTQTTSSNDRPVAPQGQAHLCPCLCVLEAQSGRSVDEQVESMRKDLTLQKSSLSKQMRKLISVQDWRPSAVVTGVVGTACLVVTFGLLLLPDLLRAAKLLHRYVNDVNR